MVKAVTPPLKQPAPTIDGLRADVLAALHAYVAALQNEPWSETTYQLTRDARTALLQFEPNQQY